MILKKSPSILLLCLLFGSYAMAQDRHAILGSINDATTGKPLVSATVTLVKNHTATTTGVDGRFRIIANTWNDTLEISIVGYEKKRIPLQKNNTASLSVQLQPAIGVLGDVRVSAGKKSGKDFMQQVIDHKKLNDPSRLPSYSYRRYRRNELDLDNMEYGKANKKKLKGLVLNIYSSFDSSAKIDKQLPIYFSETLGNGFHSSTSSPDKEVVVAKKNLGLQTDNLMQHLEKFYFHFNIYDDWLHVFDQSYVSPLNINAFQYYKFYQGDTLVENGQVLKQVRFTPLRDYERAFSGTLWINATTYAVQTLQMHLSRTADLNFIQDIAYSEEYSSAIDSVSHAAISLPSKLSCDVKFETGVALLGIPAKAGKNKVTLVIRSTDVYDRIAMSGKKVDTISIIADRFPDLEKPDSFWAANRSDSLSVHEQNIYKMTDSLKENKKFQRSIRLMALAGSGYWDFDHLLRIGPYSSFLSSNKLEGWRIRCGFWTMAGFSKQVNIYGYGAYGTADHKLKGLIGIKYLWNQSKWTKTSFSYGSDYDLIIEQDDELDRDNMLNSLLRKNIPYTRMYVKQALLKHEQYLSPNLTGTVSFSYRELNPAFGFSYNHPENGSLMRILPLAETTVGLRYARQERTSILNYDRLHLGTYAPVLSLNYTYGFEFAKAPFEYQSLNASIEHRLRLPPKEMLYYKIEAGKIFGTVPYLILNVPPGNEYYVASKYLFNTMTPYEFAADRFISLHTRFYLGGSLLDKIPLLQKLGWRERFSFNAYWGGLSAANRSYNQNANFIVTGAVPFMEASAGIENIFHVLSIEYYRRLSYLQNNGAKKSGLYLGVTLTF